MYGRLRWNMPAQTITTGFGSMGQGRYIHPSQQRTLTPHEAARLQTFPDFFDFDAVKSRGSWARMIGNAVPPLVVLQFAARLLPSLPWVVEPRSAGPGHGVLVGSPGRVRET
jgi:DNA (cytosine-5)-methyltransferase 1